VSTGRKGHSTPEGVYAILQKQKWHRSNLYSNAPMPFMQRLTWTGIALHAGHNPGHPASHGCIRMPYAFARELYDLTRIGSQVRVTMDDLAPALAVDPAAFDFGADGEVTFRFASDTYAPRVPMERMVRSLPSIRASTTSIEAVVAIRRARRQTREHDREFACFAPRAFRPARLAVFLDDAGGGPLPAQAGTAPEA
jgi:hypothetical protein